MKCVAIIPARGGSKRIPKKNIKDFHGKPIIAYSIETAIVSGLFSEVYVSTDCEEIVNVSQKYGAKVPFLRPADIADDFTGTNPVVTHMVDELAKGGKTYDFVCCLYPTAPFVRKEFLREGFEKINTHKYDFVFSATTFAFPPQRSIKILANEIAEPNFSNEFLNRSQDLDEWYHDAGQFYWGTPSSFEKYSSIANSKSSIVKLDRKFVQDIDTPEDWEYAEFLYQLSLSRELRTKKEYNDEEYGSRPII